jgi:hypothetical protein
MNTLTPFLLLAAGHLSFAEGDAKIIATSDWSKPVGAAGGSIIRARMMVAQGRSAAFAGPWPETQFYLEFQNVSSAIAAPTQFYFDPSSGLRCVMKDAQGKAPSQAGGGSGGGPGAAWITLPYDSAVRLRANMYGYGRKPGEGLLLCLWPPAQYWDIATGDTNDYYLSGTFTITTPRSFVPKDVEAARSVWTGTLELPRMKIPVQKP